MLRSSNPTLNVFQSGQVQQPASWTSLGGRVAGGVAGMDGVGAAPRSGVMTMSGTLTASAILIGLTVTSAVASYTMMKANPALELPIGIGGMLVALVIGIVLFFSQRAAPFLAPVYAIAKGGFVGWFSLLVAEKLGGGPAMKALPFQALVLTMAVAGGMLVGYATRIIRPGKVFYAVLLSATMGYALFALLAMVMALMGNTALSSLFSPTNGSALSIGISVFAVGLAAFSLIMAFEMINMGIQTGQPKYMEWYAGYALLVELVWLYIEILRLLSKLRR